MLVFESLQRFHNAKFHPVALESFRLLQIRGILTATKTSSLEIIFSKVRVLVERNNFCRKQMAASDSFYLKRYTRARQLDNRTISVCVLMLLSSFSKKSIDHENRAESFYRKPLYGTVKRYESEYVF